ncbi:hypothetical protein M406DRAFT_354974 [Cryphonectria parasitica EP155]|uniref:Uncharacterized protein n=1 Tax=Cryphonectria parasitica (strain ATCC 38755 / EP155) TaxID=660469 RepID=A0A9P5CRL3_CRYP1|nr:uncharacterized protein M406DRAFT_354974 [Cryphonectria parasitica EP155]KAF3768694.1 hypothetical protein M406DRAFT_354974 [Cryphonectria parasitica EP155]
MITWFHALRLTCPPSVNGPTWLGASKPPSAKMEPEVENGQNALDVELLLVEADAEALGVVTAEVRGLVGMGNVGSEVTPLVVRDPPDVVEMIP